MNKQLSTMNLINRHNYEEFFILYLDNELSSEDRRMVEAFVQNHPDLKEELELLTHYKLVPDESIVFENKEVLVKGDQLINIANYEEWLLLYIDNELSADQKKLVQQFIFENPFAKKELTFLQQSKFQPETIVFANKELLYWKEEKVHYMSVRWQRIAAILIVALGLTAFWIFTNNKPDTAAELVTVPVIEKTNPVIITNEQSSQENIVAEINENEDPVSIIPEKKDNIYQAAVATKKDDTPSSLNKNMATNNVVQPKKKESVLLANNNLPQPSNNPNVIKNDAAKNAIANVNVPKETKKVEALTYPVVTTKSPQPSDQYISTASITNKKEIEMESQQDDKKNKLRGLFRKLTRTFEKRTNIDASDDDDKLLIAGLAIKLK